VSITRDDLKVAHTKGVMFLDGADFYENHYQCVEHPRLLIVRAGPRGKATKDNPHVQKFYVDNMECPDLDAVLTMLNASPVVDIGPEQH
jgi:hypothetical protein